MGVAVCFKITKIQIAGRKSTPKFEVANPMWGGHKPDVGVTNLMWGELHTAHITWPFRIINTKSITCKSPLSDFCVSPNSHITFQNSRKTCWNVHVRHTLINCSQQSTSLKSQSFYLFNQLHNSKFNSPTRQPPTALKLAYSASASAAKRLRRAAEAAFPSSLLLPLPLPLRALSALAK